jgi:hypothetical protein
MEEKQSTIAKSKKSLRFQKEKDQEPVKGIFRFKEVPGGTMGFYYSQYKGEHPKLYRLKDGEVYTIPRGVARHLNNDCWYPVHSHTVDADGNPIYKVSEKKHRCFFQSLEFVDPEDFTVGESDIVTAKKV